MSGTTLKQIALSRLAVSRLNMRHGRKAPDVSDILPSIRAGGLRQTLLVRPEGDGFGIVAGRRRYFALCQIAAETGINPLVPCSVMAEDDAAAIEASLIENIARLPPTEMEQFAAFGKLHAEGRSVGDIAAFFGVSELSVRRVLALASLSAPIRKLYAREDIDRETIRALTLATPRQQAEWLKLWQSENERAPLGRNCRAWVTGGSVITTDKALFDLEAYEGAVTADLFGDGAVFADAGAFWEAQGAAMAEQVAAYRKRGWADVVVLERGSWFHRWEYESVTKKQGGKVIVEQRHDGTVQFHEGWLKASEARKARAGSEAGSASAQETVRPEMSGPMASYIGLHRHGAAQAALVQNPAIALRLMAAHALCGSALWTIRPHTPGALREGVEVSLEGSRACREMKAGRERLEALFEALGAPVPRRNGAAQHLCETFAALLACSDTEVLEVISFVMAETLESGGPVAEAVLHSCGARLGDYWSPDAAFFDLLRDKRAINGMVAEIATPDVAEGCASETAKAQKTLLQNRIDGNGCKPDPDWRPGWMQVPPARYVEGAGCSPCDAWERVAGLFEPGEACEAATGEHADAA